MGTTNKQRGRQQFIGGVLPRVTTYTASGAISLTPGLHLINVAGVGAMTLAVPTGLPDGTEAEVRSMTANAHTLTVSGGFGGTGATRDVGTFTAEVGAGLTMVVVNSLWHLRATNLVTVA